MSKLAKWLDERPEIYLGAIGRSLVKQELEESEFKQEIFKALDERYKALLSWKGEIVHWYETADRSAHSWAELDKIMLEDRDD